MNWTNLSIKEEGLHITLKSLSHSLSHSLSLALSLTLSISLKDILYKEPFSCFFYPIKFIFKYQKFEKLIPLKGILEDS